MNLVTGVFVDGAQRIAREEKNQVPLPGASEERWGVSDTSKLFSENWNDSKGSFQTRLGRSVSSKFGMGRLDDCNDYF